eukprot:TRINITY_DN5459_c0_g1_i5.p2 TRINITY_DN5459_c0_g1~~TRINITY_DN5459_c0_g1_i5.p2  ORF type:complete len:196 (+),score=65.61 TRINITY_DN5459_c0_g1_i5:123-710(+)
MKKALEQLKLQVDGEEADVVEEILFDDIDLKSIPDNLKKEIEKYKNLFYLSFNDCNLNNLDNLPNLKTLIRLELSGNKFKPTELSKVAMYKELKSLSLSKTQIQNFQDLEPLKALKNLVQLELEDCPIASKEDYRKQVFDRFPSLEILDDHDKDGNVVEVDDDDFLGEDDEDIGDEEDEEEEPEPEPEVTKKKKK